MWFHISEVLMQAKNNIVFMCTLFNTPANEATIKPTQALSCSIYVRLLSHCYLHFVAHLA